jgi:small subunit ribosomal protein S6
MRRYETIVISDPDLTEDDRASLMSRIKEIIPQQDGVLIQEDTWGIKKLAYEIKKKPRGHYTRFDYCGLGKVVDELERFFRIDDRVMKYLTVQLAASADAEQIKAELAASQATGAESAQEASAGEETAEEPKVTSTDDSAETTAEEPVTKENEEE